MKAALLGEIINVVNAELMIRTWDYGRNPLRAHNHPPTQFNKAEEKFFLFSGSPFVCCVRWHNEQVMDFFIRSAPTHFRSIFSARLFCTACEASTISQRLNVCRSRTHTFVRAFSFVGGNEKHFHKFPHLINLISPHKSYSNLSVCGVRTWDCRC